MNYPPSPSFQSAYSPYSSTYSLHTPETETSFDRFSTTDGTDRYSETSVSRTQSQVPKIVDRRPSFHPAHPSGHYPTQGVHTVSPSTMPPAVYPSTAGRDYLYFAYEKDGSLWETQPIINEIPASQTDIKKKVETRKKEHSAILNLKKMSVCRCSQINKHIDFLNSCEKDGSIWEPVYINNTNTKRKGNVMEVKAFEIIFARKQPKLRGYSTGLAPGAAISPALYDLKDTKAAKDEKSKKEKKKTKEKKAEKVPDRGALIDDPFAATEWFDGRSGAALGGQGMGVSGGPGLPPFIPPEKPIGTLLQPNIIPGLDPEKDSQQVPFGADPFIPPPPPIGLGMSATDVLDNVPNMHDDHYNERRRGSMHRRDSKRDSRDRGRRHGSRSRSRSRPRRGSMRAASDSRTRNVHWPDHRGSPRHYHSSSNSSVNSNDYALIFDEVEELSSRTSEDTAGSNGQKIYRVVSSPATRQHRPGPLRRVSTSQRYELANQEKLIAPARSRRKSSRPIELAQLDTFGFDQALTRSQTTPRQRAIVNQPLYSPPIDQLPIAVYPSYYETADRRRDDDRVEDYIRTANRERNLRDREDDVANRERNLRDIALRARIEQDQRNRDTTEMRDQLENLRLNREFGQRRGVYTHEPRDQFAFRR